MPSRVTIRTSAGRIGIFLDESARGGIASERGVIGEQTLSRRSPRAERDDHARAGTPTAGRDRSLSSMTFPTKTPMACREVRPGIEESPP